MIRFAGAPFCKGAPVSLPFMQIKSSVPQGIFSQ